MTPDRETLIGAIEQRKRIAERNNQAFVDLTYEIVAEVLALLKEQPQQIWELQDQVEYLTDKQKEHETANIYKCPNCGTWVSAENVVRCKDCKNADYGTDEDGNRFMKCIGSVRCYGGTTPDWFCADGRKKDA